MGPEPKTDRRQFYEKTERDTQNENVEGFSKEETVILWRCRVMLRVVPIAGIVTKDT
jgi:hypothetical protein